MPLFKRLASLRLLAVAMLAISAVGCGGGDAANNMESMQQLKGLVKGVLNFHESKAAYPDSLDDLTAMDSSLTSLLANPLTGDNPGYEYVKPVDESAGMSQTVVLYQLRGGKRDETLPVAYLDGSVRPIGGGE